ncbi:MAG TPA: hypothetical protein VKS23_04660 [Thermoanaerobaculia bacterium]|nr:hypothetical protein [Thermoanaerobaculia bacterium]
MSIRPRSGSVLLLVSVTLSLCVSARASVPAEASDAAAARRRTEILRSPYARSSERRALRGGELLASFDIGIPASLRDELSRDLTAFVSALVDRDAWPRPLSARSPLLVLFTAGPGVTASGWDGRDRTGALRSPVILVASATREKAAVLADAAGQLAFLSLRQAAPLEPSWAVEGAALWLSRRELGSDSSPGPAPDPFLDEAGSLATPEVLAAFLETLEGRLPRGVQDVREAWEQAGERGDDADGFLRDLVERSGSTSVGARLAEVVASHLAASSVPRTDAGAVPRRTWLAGDVVPAAPQPLGWRRVSLRTEDERAGLEIGLPDAGTRAGRLLLFYRGDGGFDSLPVFPGASRVVPAAGTASVEVVLADGDGAGEAPFHVRRVPDYPAALASSRAGWTSGGVELAWETSRHEDLLGWVVERRDETDGGAALERSTLPATKASENATGYFWLDRDAVPGHRYRYRVLALTEDGLLGEAFQASVAGR